MSPSTFAAAVLKGIGAPINSRTVGAFIGWAKAEGGDNWQRFNPLNTTESMGSAGSINSAGVKRYPNPNAGIAATVKTLKNGNYGGIVSAFRSNNPLASPVSELNTWGTGSAAITLMRQAMGGSYSVPSAKAIAQQASGATPGSPALTSQITTGGVPNAQAAVRAAVQKQLWKPINTTGKVDLSSASGFLNQIDHNIDSGQFNTPLVTKTLTAPGTPARGGQASPQLATPTNGHVNPFPGAVGSRLDQGMDMTIKNALAPFDGKVIYASASDPGWKGGGYIAIQDAHDPSRIIYIAEGIMPTVRSGQTVRAGQLVARARSNPYNGIVGNIEAGWAAANGRQPLAQTVANRPQAALSFYKWFRALGGASATSTSNAGFA